MMTQTIFIGLMAVNLMVPELLLLKQENGIILLLLMMFQLQLRNYILKMKMTRIIFLKRQEQFPGDASFKWNKSWSIGRSFHWDVPVGYINGLIDEVRISDKPLLPEEFLASQIPEPGIIWILGLVFFSTISGLTAHNNNN